MRIFLFLISFNNETLQKIYVYIIAGNIIVSQLFVETVCSYLLLKNGEEKS